MIKMESYCHLIATLSIYVWIHMCSSHNHKIRIYKITYKLYNCYWKFGSKINHKIIIFK